MPNDHVRAAAEGTPAPNTIFLALTPSLRLRLSTTIEALINLLDEIEADPDIEETGDAEPWLGWTGTSTGWRDGEPLDEADDEREQDPAEMGIADIDALQLVHFVMETCI